MHIAHRDGSGYQNGWIFGKIPNVFRLENYVANFFVKRSKKTYINVQNLQHKFLDRKCPSPPFGSFPKIHPFWCPDPSLSNRPTWLGEHCPKSCPVSIDQQTASLQSHVLSTLSNWALSSADSANQVVDGAPPFYLYVKASWNLRQLVLHQEARQVYLVSLGGAWWEWER